MSEKIALHPAARSPSPGLLQPYRWRAPKEIPRREWLYGGHYIRKFATATVSPGAVGKSSLAIVEALAMATGKPLLGIAPTQRLRVGYWNGEDPLEETDRRVAAAAMHYGLRREDLEGWLFIGSGRDNAIMVAEQGRNGPVLIEENLGRVSATIRDNRLDVFSVDPFVSTHRVAENDNGAVDMVAKAWGRIADECNVAIEIAHHTRKTMGTEITVEDGRGAGALLAAVRSCRVLNPMSEDEAARAGVERRRSHFRVDNGKANLAPPPDGSTWYRLMGLELGNGDDVAVVTPWSWPNPFDGVKPSDLLRVQQEIAAGHYRESVQAKDWAGHVVARVLGLNTDRKPEKAKISALLKAWFTSGALKRVEERDGRGETRPFVKVGAWVEV